MVKKVQFSLDFEASLEDYVKKTYPGVRDYRLINKSLDARNAPRGKRPQFNYTVELFEGNEASDKSELFPVIGPFAAKPIIIGAGPAGLFCALRLAEYGVPSIVIERGDECQKRMKEISKFWRKGELNPDSNVCYGEGGAGLFSDGKLITRIKSDYVSYVMKKFVDFGAPKEVMYLSNPHLGSNRIRGIIAKMSGYLRSKGCEFFYNTRVDELIFEKQKVTGVRLSNGQKLFSESVILATGHSAKEMYHHLHSHKVAMKAKDFAIGVRIEHPREYINQIQFGEFSQCDALGAARYRLSFENPLTKKGTYSFCMCPGGYVLSSGVDADGIVTNGMSNYAHNSPWSNSALVVTVDAKKDAHADPHILNGLKFLENIEHLAYQWSKENSSGREVPAVTVGEFLKGKRNSLNLPKTSCPSGLVKADFSEILPPFVVEHLQISLEKFNSNIKGYKSDKALLMAPETRTSSPITIERNYETFESISHTGLYPCGEGAGYAGGITSAAVDGIKVAMSLIEKKQGLVK